VREGGNRVPAIAVWPGKIPEGKRNHEIIGGLDLMATFASVAGVKLPEKDKEGQPMIFDSYDMTPVLTATGPSPRHTWYYFTEDELSPGAIRLDQFKFVFNMRGDDGAQTGGLSVDTNLGWKGASKYVATVPQTYDLYQDPQERYDIFMTNFTETTWMGPVMSQQLKEVMDTFVKYPPRKLQSVGYTGPITISGYQKFEWVREQLAKDGVALTLPTGN
jgi:arylsulfatase